MTGRRTRVHSSNEKLPGGFSGDVVRHHVGLIGVDIGRLVAEFDQREVVLGLLADDVGREERSSSPPVRGRRFVPAPDGLGAIAATRSGELRFLGEAVDRLSREYPSNRDGLTLTERRVLAAVAGGPPDAGAAYSATREWVALRWLAHNSQLSGTTGDGIKSAPRPWRTFNRTSQRCRKAAPPGSARCDQHRQRPGSPQLARHQHQGNEGGDPRCRVRHVEGRGMAAGSDSPRSRQSRVSQSDPEIRGGDGGVALVVGSCGRLAPAASVRHRHAERRSCGRPGAGSGRTG
jgi:hypothetical protein